MDTVIIIGAGASGLMAAKELVVSGHTVIVLEANQVIGGRIKTIYDKDFLQPLEAGAEFVHGKLPVTLQLLKEAGIEIEPISGKMVRITNGQWNKPDALSERWEELMQELQHINTDITVADFLQQHFNQPHDIGLKKEIISFAESYDLADVQKASVFALREEWMNDEEEQYRIIGGYGRLVKYLERYCLQQGCHIYTNHVVQKVSWQQNKVKVICSNGVELTGNKLISTVSPAVFTADITFEPAIDAWKKAMGKIGFGAVIKIQLVFNEAFWKRYSPDGGFFLSNELIPTWWVQSAGDYPLLTGWMGGPSALKYGYHDEEKIFEDAVHSLANIFNLSIEKILLLIKAKHITNWCYEPFVKGAYSYATVGMESAVQLLDSPIDDTIYFAGEAIYQGAHPGTVEAALVTGKQVAAVINGQNQ